MDIRSRAGSCALLATLLFIFPASSRGASNQPALALASGWQLQDAAKVTGTGAEVSAPGFATTGWYAATVPGTVLTTLVNNHVYPQPLYGENNRPETIPDSLVHASYWYRTAIAVPKSYKGERIWLHFDGINYSSTVWVNGAQVGTTRGAFIRGVFDISEHVKAGQTAAIAVLVAPQPHPGAAHEHTLRDGVGQNGGESAIDGPTFLCTIGWDWIPTIRDRDTGIWQKVYLSATGPAVVKDPLVTTDLPLPKIDSTDITVEATVENVTDLPVKGDLQGTIENIRFGQAVELAPHSTQKVHFDATNTPALHVLEPRLWWPNGYGAQNLYTLHLSFKTGAQISDAQDVTFGVRKISYTVPGTDTLTISVNGVPVFIRGGNWGLDEALKRIPRERLEAEIALHKLANLNLIRNWVGQSTGEDFYELCDKYGILVWDEFFQPNPGDGPDPSDLDTYIANVRDKVLRYRNHASIMLWCARNEGLPPKEIDEALRKVLAELEPTRRYQPSSTDGPGVRSHGPYSWRAPNQFYLVTDDFFKTETGSVSVPTLESIHGMMPKKDWEMIGDDWAEHDFAKGNSGAQDYPAELAARYGKVANLADFVRKAQLMNYEAYRAMYEGRNAVMFHPATAVITWMSNPAQPSFVWQLYHYDLEPNASLFAVKKAGEMIHVQFNQSTGELQVVNNLPHELKGAVVHETIYNRNGDVAAERDVPVDAQADAVTTLGAVDFPATVTAVHFLKLDLKDAEGKLLSTNFYWRALAEHPDDFTDLNTMPMVTLDAQVQSQNLTPSQRVITVTLHNSTKNIALMTHVQLRHKSTGERVLPVFYSDNYVSLAPDETRAITLEAAMGAFPADEALIVVDGWNVSVAEGGTTGVAIAPNVEAQPGHWPETGLPYQTVGLR